MTTHIEKEWESFVRVCFGTDLSKQQYIDFRRTFYGGIAGLMNIILDPKRLPTDATYDQFAEFFKELQAELIRFTADVKAGRS